MQGRAFAVILHWWPSTRQHIDGRASESPSLKMVHRSPQAQANSLASPLQRLDAPTQASAPTRSMGRGVLLNGQCRHHAVRTVYLITPLFGEESLHPAFCLHLVSLSARGLFPRLLCPELGVIIVRLKICSSVCRSSGNDRNKGLMLRSLECELEVGTDGEWLKLSDGPCCAVRKCGTRRARDHRSHFDNLQPPTK